MERHAGLEPAPSAWKAEMLHTDTSDAEWRAGRPRSPCWQVRDELVNVPSMRVSIGIRTRAPILARSDAAADTILTERDGTSSWDSLSPALPENQRSRPSAPRGSRTLTTFRSHGSEPCAAAITPQVHVQLGQPLASHPGLMSR